MSISCEAGTASPAARTARGFAGRSFGCTDAAVWCWEILLLKMYLVLVVRWLVVEAWLLVPPIGSPHRHGCLPLVFIVSVICVGGLYSFLLGGLPGRVDSADPVQTLERRTGSHVCCVCARSWIATRWYHDAVGVVIEENNELGGDLDAKNLAKRSRKCAWPGPRPRGSGSRNGKLEYSECRVIIFDGVGATGSQLRVLNDVWLA